MYNISRVDKFTREISIFDRMTKRLILKEEEKEYLCSICCDIKRLIVEKLRHESPILLLICKEWQRYIKSLDWNRLLDEWHLSNLSENVLAFRNAQPFDKHITFIGGLAHKYTITQWTGDRFVITTPMSKNNPLFMRGLLSVTTFVHHLFPEFDKVDALAKGRRGRNRRKYEGRTDEEVWQEWEDNRIKSANDGTIMHENIENYYNNLPHQTDTKEFQLFWQYQQNLIEENRIRPWRTEMMVTDLDLMLVGSIDMIYEFIQADEQFTENGKRRLVLADWKRSKEIKMSNHWQQGCVSLTKDIDDCNYEHYRMQLNIYKIILERRYNVVVIEMYLIVLHPNQDDYMKVPIAMTNHERAKIIKYRRQQIVSKSSTLIDTL